MRRRAALLAAAATALLTAAGTLTTPATAATPTAPTTPAPAPARAAACGDGSYQAEAVLNGSTWTARRGSSTVYTGTDMRAAVQAAISSLSAGRTSKERVVVRGSGSVSAGSRISLPSYTALDVCGTINVTGSGSGDQAPVYSRGTRDIEVQHLNVTGAPLYGIFLRNVQNVALGQIDMRLSAGLGVRIDNRGDTSQWTRNVRIDDVYVSGASSHAVETYERRHRHRLRRLPHGQPQRPYRQFVLDQHPRRRGRGTRRRTRRFLRLGERRRDDRPDHALEHR